jgi:hypothetical protein
MNSESSRVWSGTHIGCRTRDSRVQFKQKEDHQSPHNGARTCRDSGDKTGCDMETARRIALIFVSMMVVSAAMATTASAGLPEFEQTAQFIGVGLKTVFKSPGGTKMECQTGEIEGNTNLANPKRGKGIRINLQGCESPATVECKTAGAAIKEVRSEELEGELGYLEPAVGGAEKVGFALFPAMAGSPIAKYTCGTSMNEEKGCVIGVLEKAGVLTNKFMLTFKQTAGVEEPVTFEREVGISVRCELKLKIGGTPEQGDGLEMTQKIVSCPNMKIKS